MNLSAAYSTIYCQDSTRLRACAGPDSTCHCYPPLQKAGSALATRTAVPALWASYDNGQYYAFLPVALLEQFIREHGGQLPSQGQQLPLEQLLVTPVADHPNLVGRQHRSKTMAPITCLDGATLSVQAAEGMYCRPSNNQGPWSAVEVGRLSVAAPDSWDPYFNGGVYDRVPVELVRDFVADHGGEQLHRAHA